MNKETYHHIYQHQLRLSRELNHDLSLLWKMDQHAIQLNRLHSFEEMASNLKSIDLNRYTIFPFDTDKYSSYILFHGSFSQTLSLLSLGLNNENELASTQENSGIIEEFCCYKVSEMIAKYFNSQNIPVTVSKEPTSINMDQLSEFSTELLVSSLSLMHQNNPCGNFYIIFPNSLLGDQS